jgi:hypothetical protein
MPTPKTTADWLQELKQAYFADPDVPIRVVLTCGRIFTCTADDLEWPDWGPIIEILGEPVPVIEIAAIEPVGGKDPGAPGPGGHR